MALFYLYLDIRLRIRPVFHRSLSFSLFAFRFLHLFSVHFGLALYLASLLRINFWGADGVSRNCLVSQFHLIFSLLLLLLPLLLAFDVFTLPPPPHKR
ncbi:hypothetical protein C8F04DRAFT_1095926 [Mycena alexandri]|uniref:Uncharacterized protein n=1 Tax=Mycena alexandri TaxID=1745969 RepID=A0AAD6SZ05_9AGAR|nr:hypothetical protein C8F04DRAFT_1095926 [Mycena alexandri]